MKFFLLTFSYFFHSLSTFILFDKVCLLPLVKICVCENSVLSHGFGGVLKFVASLMCESVVVSFAKIFWYARLVSLHFPFCKYCFFFLWLLVFAGFVQVLYVLIL